MKKDTAETIELFVPHEGLELSPYLSKTLPPDASAKQKRLHKQAIHHLARYHWAAKVLSELPPGKVLDVACGSGYGSAILAQALPNHSIVGGDKDSRAIAHARKHYRGLANLKFSEVDIVTWMRGDRPKPFDKFDYIVCFDTLEYLLHREIVLINITENLSSTGCFLLSTRCGQSQNVINPASQHHKIEYSYRYLYNIMRRFFREVAVPDDRTLPSLDFWEEVVNSPEPRYFLRANPMYCAMPIAHGLAWIGQGDAA